MNGLAAPHSGNRRRVEVKQLAGDMPEAGQPDRKERFLTVSAASRHRQRNAETLAVDVFHVNSDRKHAGPAIPPRPAVISRAHIQRRNRNRLARRVDHLEGQGRRKRSLVDRHPGLQEDVVIIGPNFLLRGLLSQFTHASILEVRFTLRKSQQPY